MLFYWALLPWTMGFTKPEKSTKLCLALASMNCSPPGSCDHGILRQEHAGELPFPSPERSFPTQD